MPFWYTSKLSVLNWKKYTEHIDKENYHSKVWVSIGKYGKISYVWMRVLNGTTLHGFCKMFITVFLPCLRTPVERTRHATTAPYASQDLQQRDIDVCAILDSRANTATRVHVTCFYLEKRLKKKYLFFLSVSFKILIFFVAFFKP